ncbi:MULTISPECIES: PTS system mannose/fructose/N-acetylgalactosamine-transporter subunit IIB [Clostridium]|uniref:PTS system mannose/fructose/N-acetylgalactosamine-transporter subunit IIB n=1 Tax=Clostridium TaxID=1485 RepID=UPI000825BCFA|nr:MULTISPECIES: PTS sugar transporter subunit IIB [Clostridium]PJI08072.1 PTS system mannose/fructose/N-acetylgalactosamine-transporter subunit IIB [Clostridium sp. CT7]
MIIHVRIDERLIHGQVATMWTNNLKASRIMVVDDSAAKDDMVKMSLKLATPDGVKLSILSAKKAAANILNGKYEGQRVFLIAKRPETLVKLIELGVELTQINVGNMSHSEGKQKITNTISVTKEDVEAFKKLEGMGIKLTAQLVPSHPSENFMELLKKNTK